MRRSLRTRIRRTAAVGLAVATMSGMISVAPAGAASTAESCPVGQVPPGGFRDVKTGDTHQVGIDCLVWWGITGGTRPEHYSPETPINRAQLATMLDRLLRKTGDHPGTVPQSTFSDVARPGTHALAIDVLAHLGVVTGKNGKFNPDATVTRDQMATMLVRLLGEKVYLLDLPLGTSFVDTVGNTHETAIRYLVGAGVTGGTGGGKYSPSGTVSRAQMASFVMRSADLLVTNDLAIVPAARGIVTDYILQPARSDKPNRWDPCTPIPYRINASRSKKTTSVADTHEAIRRISAATGLTFSYEGTSTEIPQNGYGQTVGSDGTLSWAPLLIAWADSGQSDLLAAYPTAVGLGGASALDAVGSEPFNTSVTGLIVIRATTDANFPSGFGAVSSGQLLMHEIGHVIGLGHAASTDQTMFSTMTYNPGTWGAGDLTGLRLLGKTEACASSFKAAGTTSPTEEAFYPDFLIDHGPEAPADDHTDH